MVADESRHDTTTEIGADRQPEPFPSASERKAIAKGVHIKEHQKATIFADACNNIARFGYDHSNVVTPKDIETLFQVVALSQLADSHVHALKALSVLLIHRDVRASVSHTPGVLRTLERLLKTSTEETLPWALLVVGNAMADVQNKRNLATESLVKLLIDCSSSDDEVVQIRACTCLVNLCMGSPANMHTVVTAGGVPVLLGFLANSSAIDPVTHRVVTVLNHMAKVPAIEEQLLAAAANISFVRKTSSASRGSDAVAADEEGDDGDRDGSVDGDLGEAGVEGEASEPAAASAAKSEGAADDTGDAEEDEEASEAQDAAEGSTAADDD